MSEVFTDRLRKFHVSPPRRELPSACDPRESSSRCFAHARRGGRARSCRALERGAGACVHAEVLQNRFGDQTYVPTRVPTRYRYSRWQKVNDSLVLTFKERTSTDTFRFEVSKLAPTAPCDGGGAFHRIIQTDGNEIYYGGDKGYWKAWRCVVSTKTNTRYVLTALSNGKLSDIALAQVSASGKRFAKP